MKRIHNRRGSVTLIASLSLLLGLSACSSDAADYNLSSRAGINQLCGDAAAEAADKVERLQSDNLSPGAENRLERELGNVHQDAVEWLRERAEADCTAASKAAPTDDETTAEKAAESTSASATTDADKAEETDESDATTDEDQTGDGPVLSWTDVNLEEVESVVQTAHDDELVDWDMDEVREWALSRTADGKKAGSLVIVTFGDQRDEADIQEEVGRDLAVRQAGACYFTIDGEVCGSEPIVVLTPVVLDDDGDAVELNYGTGLVLDGNGPVVIKY